MFYERVEGNYLFSAVNNPPFVQQSLIYYGNVDKSGGRSASKLPEHHQQLALPRHESAADDELEP